MEDGGWRVESSLKKTERSRTKNSIRFAFSVCELVSRDALLDFSQSTGQSACDILNSLTQYERPVID